MTVHRWLFPTLSALTAACLPSGQAALAADPAAQSARLPAVSGVNGVLGGYAGNLIQDHTFGGFASVAAPLDASFGAQLDVNAGSALSAGYREGAAHLFWRDPSLGLLGGYASYLRWSKSDTYMSENLFRGVYDNAGAKVGKAGLEAQVYLARFTLAGVGAYQFGTYKGVAAKGALASYLIDNLRVDFTVNAVKGSRRNASLGLEWAPSDRAPFTLFARAGMNQERDVRVLGGLQIYFSRMDKSLIRRHREDLVTSDLPDNLFQAIGDDYCPIGTALRNGFCDGNV